MKQIEDMRKKQEEETKKKAEDQKRLEEEEAKRRQDEIAKKKEVEDKRRLEQKSTLAIRRVIQKVRVATPENFDVLQQELKEVLAQELENSGSQRARMTEESEKGLEQARA